ncbi:MAG: tripartite tricarboxylate transporter substrate binding protein [Betaproteobacteria bacterium]|nr:tripartite tricarboxylate transporter substrate binding protein [Betaproteobacteria bacterium]
MNRRDLLRSSFATGLTAFTSPLFAQSNYPNKPITMIVPFPPGGVTDLVARELAKRLTEAFGQACTVENKAGAGGNIGTATLARAVPDGYTLGVMTVSAISIAPHVTPNLPFNPDKDFTPITNIVNTPGALLAGIKTPFQSISDLIRAAKERPGKITYASVGNGSLPHLVGERFCKTFGIELVHVPYKGAAPAMQDLLGGHLASNVSPTAEALPHHQAGTIRILAVTGAKRSRFLPDVPSMQELGFKDVLFQDWLGMFAPLGTPAEIVSRMNAAAAAAVKSEAGSAGQRAQFAARHRPLHLATRLFRERAVVDTDRQFVLVNIPQ